MSNNVKIQTLNSLILHLYIRTVTENYTVRIKLTASRRYDLYLCVNGKPIFFYKEKSAHRRYLHRVWNSPKRFPDHFPDIPEKVSFHQCVFRKYESKLFFVLPNKVYPYMQLTETHALMSLLEAFLIFVA